MTRIRFTGATLIPDGEYELVLKPNHDAWVVEDTEGNQLLDDFGSGRSEIRRDICGRWRERDIEPAQFFEFWRCAGEHIGERPAAG